MIKRGKRGSHIDVIISFVIFIVFLGFLYSILAPAKVQEDKEAVLNYLEKTIKDELSSNLTSASFKITTNSPKECYQILKIIDDENLNVTIKDSNNLVVPFENYEIPFGDKYFRIDGTPEEGEDAKKEFNI